MFVMQVTAEFRSMTSIQSLFHVPTCSVMLPFALTILDLRCQHYSVVRASHSQSMQLLRLLAVGSSFFLLSFVRWRHRSTGVVRAVVRHGRLNTS